MKFINIKQKSFFEIRNFYNSLDKDYSHFYNLMNLHPKRKFIPF